MFNAEEERSRFSAPRDLAGAITGPGAFTKTGAGELVLEGSGNSYAGGTSIDAGTLTVATDSLLGDPAHGVALRSGALTVGGGFTSARTMTIGKAAARSTPQARARPSPEFSRGWARSPRQFGEHDHPDRDNDYGVGTTISGGTLQLGNGGTTAASSATCSTT
jgi:fibronectin-binding autotransporter adhesin